jgi:hypothetical protein
MEIVFYSLLVIAILGLIIGIIYQLRKAGTSLSDTVGNLADRVLGPDKVITPAELQKFIDEPANQPGGYVPWTPEDDD